jgi:hypothetical protein
MTSVVTRYRNSTAIAIWEPVGEPEASSCEPGYIGGECYGHTACPADASAVLRQFFDNVGAMIHRLDPNHLVGDGALGGSQCGWTGTGPQLIDSSPAINVVSYHDYWGMTAPPMPVELAGRIALAMSIGKPLFVGEVGMDAGTAAGCAPLNARASEMRAKLDAALHDGVAGWLLWAYGGSPARRPNSCDLYLMGDDPAMSLVASAESYMWPQGQPPAVLPAVPTDEPSCVN